MKKKISQFEFALTEAFDPEEAKKCEPRTDVEELEIRQNNIKRQLSKFKHR